MAVVVLGSKPNPIIPQTFNSIIYVNGSIYYQLNISTAGSMQDYHIMTTAMFGDDRTAFHECGNKKVNKAIVSGADLRKIDYYKDMLNKINYTYKEIQFISKQERAQMINKVIGKKQNLIIALKNNNINFRNKASNVLQIIISTGRENKNFKPSTGVFSLLYALFYEIGEPPYYLCGVGAEKDGHAYGPGLKYNTSHVFYDINILKTLASNSYYQNNIIVSDPKMSTLSGLKSFVEYY